MTLITKEDKDSYNAVIANVNQKVSSLIDELDKLISTSESNAATEEDSFNTLIKKANNLKTYVSGLLTINKQLDANMPDSCNYKWVYTETEYNCAESSDCGEDCGEGGEDCGEICNFCNDECGEPYSDCSEPCSYYSGDSGDCEDCGNWESCEE